MDLPSRKSTRLKGFDYSQDRFYFITICSYNRECSFGEIINNKMVLNNIGKIIKDNLELLSNRFPIELNDYQIMPNHLHSIIKIVGVQFIEPEAVQFIEPKKINSGNNLLSGAINYNSGAINCAPTETERCGGLIHQTHTIHQTRKPTLGQIIRYFKAKSSHSIGIHIWQRNYYEHIIRNETDFLKIKEYIKLNPIMWDQDKNNPKNLDLSD